MYVHGERDSSESAITIETRSVIGQLVHTYALRLVARYRRNVSSRSRRDCRRPGRNEAEETRYGGNRCEDCGALRITAQ